MDYQPIDWLKVQDRAETKDGPYYYFETLVALRKIAEELHMLNERFAEYTTRQVPRRS